jgi:lipopolysaccharide biosynthesis glycosyltransferase
MEKQMKNKIDIAVCYHKESPIFQNEALKPMQLGKAINKIALGIRGDDTGDNMSTENKFYAEDTAFYWLWKNSEADIKGIMHYLRLLDLNGAGNRDRSLILDDVKPDVLINELGLTESRISELMKDNDVLIRQSVDIFDWFAGNIEEQYKATHIPEYWDYMMKIIKTDFPDIYPAASRLANSHFGWFQNIVVMRGKLFDQMCAFRFSVLQKLETKVDRNRLEIALGEPMATRYAAFLGERLTMIFVKYLQEQGTKIAEFPIVSIITKENGLAKTSDANAYAKTKATISLKPAFTDKNAVAIMLATDDNYAPYCGVMIQSIIDNANPSRNYDIVVAGNMNETKQLQLLSMATENISVRVLDVKPFLADIDISIFQLNNHFSIETYYRFFIPRIFANYKKVLYLDVDMVVLRDVAELYDTEMGDNWWAATRDKVVPVLGFNRGSYDNKVILPYIKNTLKMDSVFDYFQAGVMLWNVPQCEKDKVEEQCLAKLKELGNPIYVDQSVMNSVANGKHILYIPGYWNALWFWTFYGARQTEALETAIRQVNNAYIIHFASGRKPWTEPALPNADKFWQYARKTPFYETILFAPAVKEKRDKEIAYYKKKIKRYRLLNSLFFGIIKSFRKRRNHYRNKLKTLEPM